MLTAVVENAGLGGAFSALLSADAVKICKPSPKVYELVLTHTGLELALSHRICHGVGMMWRAHRVHHSETDLDLTTGLRFHPLEALLSQGLFLATIAVLCPPPAAVVCAALASILQDFFTHANLRGFETGERVLRLLIITPSMHRVHHSESIVDQNRNFGTVFSLWDRIFGTFHPDYPLQDGVLPARYGLAELANGSKANAVRLFCIPFESPKRAMNVDVAQQCVPISCASKEAYAKLRRL